MAFLPTRHRQDRCAPEGPSRSLCRPLRCRAPASLLEARPVATGRTPRGRQVHVPRCPARPRRSRSAPACRNGRAAPPRGRMAEQGGSAPVRPHRRRGLSCPFSPGVMGVGPAAAGQPAGRSQHLRRFWPGRTDPVGPPSGRLPSPGVCLQPMWTSAWSAGRPVSAQVLPARPPACPLAPTPMHAWAPGRQALPPGHSPCRLQPAHYRSRKWSGHPAALPLPQAAQTGRARPGCRPAARPPAGGTWGDRTVRLRRLSGAGRWPGRGRSR
jgi:hypothetical protein